MIVNAQIRVRNILARSTRRIQVLRVYPGMGIGLTPQITTAEILRPVIGLCRGVMSKTLVIYFLTLPTARCHFVVSFLYKLDSHRDRITYSYICYAPSKCICRVTICKLWNSFIPFSSHNTSLVATEIIVFAISKLFSWSCINQNDYNQDINWIISWHGWLIMQGSSCVCA